MDQRCFCALSWGISGTYGYVRRGGQAFATQGGDELCSDIRNVSTTMKNGDTSDDVFQHCSPTIVAARARVLSCLLTSLDSISWTMTAGSLFADTVGNGTWKDSLRSVIRVPLYAYWSGGAISFLSRSRPLRIAGTLSSQRYTTELLEPDVLSLLRSVPGDVFQQETHWNTLSCISMLGPTSSELFTVSSVTNRYHFFLGLLGGPICPSLNTCGIWLLERWPVCHPRQSQLMNCGYLRGTSCHKQKSWIFIAECHAVFKRL